MDETTMSLARRAVACAAWRWMPGMRHTTTIKGEEWFCCRVAEKDAPREPRHPDALPDLDDPATLGCLLALVREAWGDQQIHASCGAGGKPIAHWVVWRYFELYPTNWQPIGSGTTEAEALVAALEAAVSR